MQLRLVVEQDIAEYAATQARMIKLIPIFLAAASPTRDAWCAARHG